MKQLMMLLLLSSIAYEAYPEIIAKRLPAHNSSIKEYQSTSCCSPTFDCPRGKRGRRGRRGRTGATGATGPIAPFNLRDELFINASMMTDMIGSTPNTFFTAIYGTPTVLSAWELVNPFDPENPIGMQFVIPSTLDATQPVTLTIHCFNLLLEAFGDVRFEVQIDYKSNGEEFGANLPATGYAETLFSGDIPIIDPIFSPNGRYFTVTIPLNAALMAGKTWSELVVSRVPTTNNNNYQGSIFLTAFSIQYTKTVS